MKSAYTITLLHSQPLLVVEGKINGRGPLRFSIDTGASSTVITPGAARRVRLANRTNKIVKGVSASTVVPAFLVKIDFLEIGNLSVHNLDAAVMNLSTVNRATHLNLDGILGYNFLCRYRVTIDYKIGTVKFQV